MSATAAIEALALSAPVVVSCAGFAPRRVSKGMKALDDKENSTSGLYGLMNFDIAAGQTLKGLRAARAMSIASDFSGASSIEKISNTMKNASKGSKFLKGVGEVVKFTADNVNPIIIAASGVKVLGSDDKVEAAERETINLGFMFGAEALAKNALGMPKTEKNPITGEKVSVPRESWLGKTTVGEKINKFFGESQKSAMNDLKETKMFFNKVPAKAVKGGLKGAAFVTASILGYKLGEVVSNVLLGEEKSKTAKQKAAV